MELSLHCFGASTTSGEALRNLSPNNFIGYSRNLHDMSSRFHFVDLHDPLGFSPVVTSSAPSILVSFAPIWLLAPFLDVLAKSQPECLSFLRGVIACSSSSVLTKRFSFNDFDRRLYARLISSEDKLIDTCRSLSLPCCILRPTLIYGQAGGLSDRNLSFLLNLMLRLPLIPVPPKVDCGNLCM